MKKLTFGKAIALVFFCELAFASERPASFYECKIFDPLHGESDSFLYEANGTNYNHELNNIKVSVFGSVQGAVSVGLYEVGVEAGPYSRTYAEGYPNKLDLTFARDRDYVAIVQCVLAR